MSIKKSDCGGKGGAGVVMKDGYPTHEEYYGPSDQTLEQAAEPFPSNEYAKKNGFWYREANRQYKLRRECHDKAERDRQRVVGLVEALERISAHASSNLETCGFAMEADNALKAYRESEGAK